MKFIYTPDGADPREWEFEPSKLMSPEAEAIERFTGMTFGTWQAQVMNGSVLAVHGLLYVLLKRTNPTVRYDEIVFAMGEVEFKFDATERRAIIEGLKEKKATEGYLDPDATEMLARLEAEEAADEQPVVDPDDDAEPPFDPNGELEAAAPKDHDLSDQE